MEGLTDANHTAIAAERALLKEWRLQRRLLRRSYSAVKAENQQRIESTVALVQYVLENVKNDPLCKSVEDDDEDKSDRNPYCESLPSQRFFNPFSAKTKLFAKYSNKSRHELYNEQKKTKDIDDWLEKIKKRRSIAAMDPFLVPKVTGKPAKPRYRVAIMGARGSGRRTLFTQLKRLAEDPTLDQEIFGSAAGAEVITQDLLSGALPLIRMNCLMDAQIIASKSYEKANLSLDQLRLCRRIMATKSWDETIASDISDFWSDIEIKKFYESLRRIDPSAEHVYLSSSSPYFLDHVMQYAYHGYVPTVQEYLQAEKVASVFFHQISAPVGTSSTEPKEYISLVPEKRRRKSSRDPQRVDLTAILSTEILCSLLSFFTSPADLGHLAQVNKSLHKLTELPYLWRNLAKVYFFPAPRRLETAKSHFKKYWCQPTLHQPRLEEINIMTPDFGFVPTTHFRVVHFGSLTSRQRQYLFSRCDDFSALIYMVDVSIAGPAFVEAMRDWRSVVGQFKTHNRIVFMNKCDVLRDIIKREKPDLTEEQRDDIFQARVEHLEEVLIREARTVVRNFFTLSLFRTNLLQLESSMFSMCAVSNAIRWNFQWQRQNRVNIPLED